jgi:two-component system KDP operon response regulator KdpE
MPRANRVSEYVVKIRDAVSTLNRKDGEPDETVQTGDFRLNVTARKARLRGKELELTAAEFDLLLFLVNHPSRLVTAHTRLATNWTSTAVRQAEFLPTLASLRRKLESVDSARCYIRTEPWVFYRFDANGSPHGPAVRDQQAEIT